MNPVRKLPVEILEDKKIIFHLGGFIMAKDYRLIF